MIRLDPDLAIPERLRVDCWAIWVGTKTCCHSWQWNEYNKVWSSHHLYKAWHGEGRFCKGGDFGSSGVWLQIFFSSFLKVN